MTRRDSHAYASQKIKGSLTVATENEILFYAMNYAPELTGVGKYTGEIAEFMGSTKANVTVITTQPHYPGWKMRRGNKNNYQITTNDGTTIYRCPLFLGKKVHGFWRLVAPISFAISSIPILIYVVARKRPKIIFCVEPTLLAAPVVHFVSKFFRTTTILHVQDLEVDAAFAMGHIRKNSVLKRIALAFERMNLNSFDRVITISEKMADQIRGKSKKHAVIEVIRNWVDLEHIYPIVKENTMRAELSIETGKFVALYSGNIGPKQGLDVVLDAAEQLQSDRRFLFIIAGEGPVKADLIQRYGHLKNVWHQPLQPYSRLNEFLNIADVHLLPQAKGVGDLVLPSKVGGMLATGKPIIAAADVDTELFRFLDGAGTLVPTNDVPAMVDALNACIAGVELGDEHVRLAKSRELDKGEAMRAFERILVT